MLLYKYTSDIPIQIENENNMATRSFMVGTNAGIAIALEIEATTEGVIVRREGAHRDLLLRGGGVGELLNKAEVASVLQDAPISLANATARRPGRPPKAA